MLICSSVIQFLPFYSTSSKQYVNKGTLFVVFMSSPKLESYSNFLTVGSGKIINSTMHTKKGMTSNNCSLAVIQKSFKPMCYLRERCCGIDRAGESRDWSDYSDSRTCYSEWERIREQCCLSPTSSTGGGCYWAGTIPNYPSSSSAHLFLLPHSNRRLNQICFARRGKGFQRA